MTAAETAVRTYLNGLKNPASLRDSDRIKSLNDQITSSDDPVERLRLQQERIEAETPSVDSIEEQFVQHAKAWADNMSITPDAFLAEGVDPAVLRRAGFRVAGRRSASPGGRRRAPVGGSTRVNVETVRDALPKKGATFTVRSLVDSTGASIGSVRKVIAEELKGKRIEDVGTDPDHQGPGRAPNLYKRR